ncbi:MAG: hypothetical protein M1831_003432 [Alyxoria varia]|nr:MAG: hypothetical protein M1831_003432 [Alyxoria varia]
MRHNGGPPGPGELANGQPRRRIPVNSRGIDWEPVDSIQTASSYAVNHPNPSPPLPVIDQNSWSGNGVQARRSNPANQGQRQPIAGVGPFGYDSPELDTYGHQSPYCTARQNQDMASQYPTSPAYANMPASYDSGGQPGGRAMSWSSPSNLSPLAMSTVGNTVPGNNSFSDRQLPMPSPARMPGMPNGGTNTHNSMPLRTSVNWNNQAFSQNAQSDPNSMHADSMYAARRSSNTHTSPRSANPAQGKDVMGYVGLPQGNNDQTRRDHPPSWPTDYAAGTIDAATKSVRLESGYQGYGTDSAHRAMAYSTPQTDSNHPNLASTTSSAPRNQRGSM